MTIEQNEEFESGPIIVVGLGNPGAEYKNTRHNVGFEVIDLLSQRHNIPIKKRSMRSVIGDGTIESRKVFLVKPMTYMNLSGEAAGAVSRMYHVVPKKVIVVVDDIALPLGRLRLRPKGSAGGHNGLTSMEKGLKTQEYPRIRIGVGGANPGRMVDHVLGKFRADEKQEIEDAISIAADAVERIIRDGIDIAMNAYNIQPETATNSKEKTNGTT
ncbi:MAG: aminoacyl-tRNA hydrolase [Chthonomonadales bacterium]